MGLKTPVVGAVTGSENPPASEESVELTRSGRMSCLYGILSIYENFLTIFMACLSHAVYLAKNTAREAYSRP
jgi:hypothetical protein